MQIRAIMVPYRIEVRRQDPATMEQVRQRARSLLDGLGEAVLPFPDLEARLVEARQELDMTTDVNDGPARHTSAVASPIDRSEALQDRRQPG